MKSNIIKVFASAICLFSSLSLQYAHATSDIDFGMNLKRIIDKDRALYQIPGVEVTVISLNTGLIRDFVSGTTIINGNTDVNYQNLFQVGSETKSFIAITLLQLEAQGALSLDDKISKWLLVKPEWSDITIRQLLNHTSGIYNYTDTLMMMILQNPDFDLSKQWTNEELISMSEDQPLYFTPGTGWHYSNANYTLAGMIIEKVTGHNLADEIEARFTKPFYLEDTYYVPGIYPDNILSRMAHGYSASGLFPVEPKDVTEANMSWANSAGAVVSTSHDMAMWLRLLVNRQLLPEKQNKELFELVNQADGKSIPSTMNASGYSLGLFHDYNSFNEETWYHSGGTLGYSALMVWLKSSNYIVAVNVNHINSDDPAKRDTYLLTRDLISYIQSDTMAAH